MSEDKVPGGDRVVTRSMLEKAFDAYSDAWIDSIKRMLAGPRVDGRFEALEKRITELATELVELKAEPLLKNGGIWRHGSVYTPGDLAQFKGSRWVCTKAHAACGSPDHSCWQLWEKGGKR